ncbi:MAG: hypothetical protein ACUVTH_00470 [Thermogutta sp.]
MGEVLRSGRYLGRVEGFAERTQKRPLDAIVIYLLQWNRTIGQWVVHVRWK